MTEVATAILLDPDGHLLAYLRDDESKGIPFPNHWDLFGGHVEDGETPIVALRREIQEELGIHVPEPQFFRKYECLEGDVRPNTKHVFWSQIQQRTSDLILREGQRLGSIPFKDRHQFRFANILGSILDDFVASYEDGNIRVHD